MNVDAFVALLGDFLDRDDLTPAQLLSFTNLGRVELQRRLVDWPRQSTVLPYTAGGIALPTDWKGFPFQRCVTWISTASARTPAILTRWNNIQQRRSTTEDSRQYAYTKDFGAEDARYIVLFPDQTTGSIELIYSRWLPEYVAGGAEDLILKYGADVLLLFSLAAYNLFSKEEDKVSLDVQMQEAKLGTLMDMLSRQEASGAIIDR